MWQIDSYAKLRPPEPTPIDELCQCVGAPVKLMCAFSYNPVHCMDCNLAVPPETLALPESIVEAIVRWREVYEALCEEDSIVTFG